MLRQSDHGIRRTAHRAATYLEDVRVDHRRGHVRVPEQFLDRADVVALYTPIEGAELAMTASKRRILATCLCIACMCAVVAANEKPFIVLPSSSSGGYSAEAAEPDRRSCADRGRCFRRVEAADPIKVHAQFAVASHAAGSVPDDDVIRAARSTSMRLSNCRSLAASQALSRANLFDHL